MNSRSKGYKTCLCIATFRFSLIRYTLQATLVSRKRLHFFISSHEGAYDIESVILLLMKRKDDSPMKVTTSLLRT